KAQSARRLAMAGTRSSRESAGRALIVALTWADRAGSGDATGRAAPAADESGTRAPAASPGTETGPSVPPRPERPEGAGSVSTVGTCAGPGSAIGVVTWPLGLIGSAGAVGGPGSCT